jgi:hypothetical protein
VQCLLIGEGILRLQLVRQIEAAGLAAHFISQAWSIRMRFLSTSARWTCSSTQAFAKDSPERFADRFRHDRMTQWIRQLYLDLLAAKEAAAGHGKDRYIVP